jgi:hypothetical protein
MTFDVMHVIWALIISVGYIIAGWLFGMLGEVGGFLYTAITLLWLYGLMFFGMKGVKGVTNGLVTGLTYGLVFAVVAIIFSFIKWGGPAPFIGFSGDFGLFFGWPGMWGQLVAVILFGGCIGWVNESK